MRNYFTQFNLLFLTISVLGLTQVVAAQQSFQPPLGQEFAEVTDFVGGTDAEFKNPFQVQFLTFTQGRIPKEIENHTAQWFYPPEDSCQGDLILNGSTPRWSMLCRSGWMATGIFKSGDTPKEYLAEGHGPKGSIVSFKLKTIERPAPPEHSAPAPAAPVKSKTKK